MTTKPMLISVIIPVYKVEKYLDKCLESVVNQTYKNLEIILVDDGSPDNCPVMCDEWAKKDSRIVVIHKENGGLSSARNAGVAIAKGEWIGFVDSDDYIAPEMYEKMLFAAQKSGAELCVCGMKWINEDGSEFKEVLDSPIVDEILTKEQMYSKLVEPTYFHYVTSVNKLYKKELFEKVTFPEGRLHEDEFTAHHFFNACGKIVTIKEKLYFYLQRQNSIMNSKYSIKRLDAAHAFYDRYIFLKRKRNKAKKLVAQQFYGVLCENIWKSSILKHWKEILPLVLKCVFALFPDLRFVKLLLVLLRKSLGDIIRCLQTIVLFLPYSPKDKNGRILLVATPQHGNLGDQALVFTEYKVLSQVFDNRKIIEIPNENYLRFGEMIQRFVHKNDMIVIDGGGNLGTLWPHEDDKISDIINQFKKNKTIVFPQTCYYDNTFEARERLKKNQKIYSEAKDLTMMFRDEESYNFAMEKFEGVRTLFVPDFVLSFTPNIEKKQKSGVLLCFRTDKEKVLSDEIELDVKNKLNEIGEKYKETSTVISKFVSKKNRKEELYKKWEEFASAKLVITDRLHAMIFSAITETPCIAVDNKSKKVGGTYKWIKDLPYICYLENANDICDNIEKFINCLDNDYNFEYPIESVVKVLKEND